MCKCRYYGKCAGNCDGRGLVLGFGNETYDCDSFQPLPDMEALLKLADECDDAYEANSYSAYDEVARRIRNALGLGCVDK